ncbi:hypothetical protein CEXT_195621 [Caerostris extrusa]|uniref:Uncharacterized protein n=1 Tax=Caerostris extrusa TaxID=172846 RepID=A0AAV4P829_CAEEX|nr:hypothetical protein CEXT_195621 [Caerostris extrusa]
MSGCEENPEDFLFFCGPEETDVPFPSLRSHRLLLCPFPLCPKKGQWKESVLFIDAEVAYRMEGKSHGHPLKRHLDDRPLAP